MEHTRHDYLSEACFHAEHDSCGTAPAAEGDAREPSSCRFCGVVCRCACHPVAIETVTRENFIPTILRARKARGWSQEWLGQLVGVNQRTVSAWENGAPPPSGPVLQRLCAALGLKPDLDRDFRGPLVLPTLDTLPFRDLTPSQFNAFAADLIKATFPDADIDTPARHSDIDLSLETHSGERIGVKCFPGRTFHAASFDKARSETDLNASGLDRCLLLLRTRTSTKVQEHAAAQPVWEIWDAQALVERLRALEPAIALKLVERHFPGLGAPFLGIEP
jgi:transcriptional regulator with XRE-family HTH domain